MLTIAHAAGVLHIHLAPLLIAVAAFIAASLWAASLPEDES